MHPAPEAAFTVWRNCATDQAISGGRLSDTTKIVPCMFRIMVAVARPDLPFTSWRQLPGRTPGLLMVGCETLLQCPPGSAPLAALLAAKEALVRVI